MIRLATVIKRFETAFVGAYRQRLTNDHYRALAAIKHCRTDASPTMQVECTGCAYQKRMPHSCGHRHCPQCQHHESQQWLERQLQKQVPAEYFLLTFTLPAEFRPLAFVHQKVVYELLLRSAWETVRTFSHNDRRLQGTAGAIAVLHTHTRKLDYHPHVHLVMPAAAVDAEHRQWRTKVRGNAKRAYLFNHKALATVFRAKLLAAIAAAGLTLPLRYPKHWVVDCKSVGSGEKALVYLGRYLYRGVIREHDIVACSDTTVTFSWQDGATGTTQQRTLAGAQFLWLIVQHVLPKGFRRARNFGFLHPNCKRLIALLHLLLKVAPRVVGAWVKARAPILCSCCGAIMVIVKTRLPSVFREGIFAPPVGTGAIAV